MGSKSSTPSSDPRVGEAAMMQAETGQEMAELGRQQFQLSKQQTEQFAPIYEQLLQQAIAEGDKNSARADQQWDQYTSVFQPIENQMAEEALNYDSPEEVARREGLAAATTARAFDASQDAMAREMGRMGVSPTSTLGAQGMRDQANAKALAEAGAVNQERNNAQLMGMTLRQQAAQFGRGQTSTGLAASAQALQGGQSATGIMGAQTQQSLAGAQTAGSLMGGGASQMGSAANTLLNQWTTQVNAASSANSGLGSLIGTGIGAAASIWSSKELKEGGQEADDDEALAGLESVPVQEGWKYKPGVSDGGAQPHDGPYAEDMHRAFGNDVAPGGIGLDMISVSGKHHAAIRALAKRVHKLEKGGAGLADVLDQPGDTAPERAEETLPVHLRGDLAAGLVGLE